MLNFIITIIIGILVGYIFLKMKVPGGIMVGAIIGVSVFNVTTGMAYIPLSGKIAAQIIAGAFIGSGIEKSDLIRLRSIFKPTITILLGLLLLNIVMGLLIYVTSPMDLITSFMCAIPGGMSDIPIISEEMGADSAKVAVMQFIRMVFGIGVFPTMIQKVSRLKLFKDEESEADIYKRTEGEKGNSKDLFLTLLVAAVFGVIGRVLKIPSGTLVFSMVSVIIFKLVVGKTYMPRWIKRVAQVLSGAYIGSSVNYADVIEIKYLMIPAIILISGYAISCLLLGFILHRKFNLPTKDAMLACTPAGATDMALIAADIGVESADVIVMQIIRLVVVVGLFPQIIRLLVSMIG